VAAQAGPDRAAAEREPVARGARDQAARGQDQEAATSGVEAFRLPSADERAARARDEAARRDRAGARAAGDDFWDRVSEELSGSGGQGPVRPAWPSTAGPRAMGAGSAAKYGPAGTGDDEPEAAWSPPGYRQAEPASWGGEPSRPAGGPDEGDEQGERPPAGETRWERMVPPYVDDLSGPRLDREPAGPGSGELPAGEDSSAGEGAGAAAGQEAGSAWSAWSTFRATQAEEQAASGGHDVRGQGGQRDADEQPSEGDVTSGDAAASGEASRDESSGDEAAAAASATDVAGDERGDSVAAEPAALDATPGAALADAADAGGTDEAAGRGTEAEEPGPGTAEPNGSGAGEVTAADEHAAQQDTAGAGDGAEADADGATPPDDEVTIVPGVARYHRRGCILIRFLSDGDLETMTRREAEATELVPCKACQPDKPDPSA
jgi:hypothetical protein